MQHESLDNTTTFPSLRTAPPLYADAITALAAALLIRHLLTPWLGTQLPLVTVSVATALAAWRTGVLAALFVAVAGYVASGYVLSNADAGRIAFATLGGGPGLVGYLLTSALIIGFARAAHTARTRDRHGRELLNAVLHCISDAVITTDTALRITSMNKRAETLTGWTEALALGRPLDAVFKIVDADYRMPIANPADAALHEDAVPDLARPTVLVGKAGTEFDIDHTTALIRDPRGDVSACVLVFRDISSERQVARVLEAQCAGAKLLASIVESSNDAIVETTLDGIVQSWNPAAESLFGYTPAEAIGRNISFLSPFDRPSEVESILARVSEGRRVEHLVTERLCSDFESVKVGLTVSPMRNNDGDVTGALTIARSLQSV